MPDIVTIGNEVDTGFFGSLASPTGNNLCPVCGLARFRACRAVLDASSDATIDPAIPAPLRCIHITPAWNLTSFFDLVNSKLDSIRCNLPELLSYLSWSSYRGAGSHL